jgi:hypothetical protein
LVSDRLSGVTIIIIKGFIAAATTTRQLVRRDGALFAPGVDPARLMLLLLQLVQQCGWQGGDVHVSASLLSLIPHTLQYFTPASHPASDMHEVVRVMWMGLGQQLLRAAGRSEEEEDSISAQPAGTEGSAAGAQGAARGSTGMSTGLCVMRVGKSELIEIPATAAGQVIGFMWPRFSICLLRSFTWLEGECRAAGRVRCCQQQVAPPLPVHVSSLSTGW